MILTCEAQRRATLCLTGIACDMPLEATDDDLRRRAPDLAAIDAFSEAQGFGRMLRERARKLAG